MHGAATFCVNIISILDYGHLLDSYWYYTLEYMHLHFIHFVEEKHQRKGCCFSNICTGVDETGVVFHVLS